ncbi:MAG: hypothetical protein JW969_20530 [Spirochaetales bacterium]|nr:hypothetical protein [Spirochaetales bacterium]
MKKQLETLPILEAYEQASECPLCYLRNKLEKNFTDFFLGASVMEPIVRAKVNEKGFCPGHFTRLFKHGNKHGLALMVHTHLLESNPKLLKALEAVKSTAGTKQSLINDLLASKRDVVEGIKTLTRQLEKHTSNCVFCDKLSNTLERYAFTIVYLWRKEAGFKETFGTSKGFCLPHLPLVLDMAARILSPARLKEFMEITVNLCSESLKRLEGEVLWFTQKFDYRNNDKPWETSKDSVPRALQKLNGRIFE